MVRRLEASIGQRLARYQQASGVTLPKAPRLRSGRDTHQAGLALNVSTHALGEVWQRTTHFALASIEGPSHIDMAHLAELALDQSLAPLDASQLVFFDTETTGLARGAGTVAFLVGIGFVSAGTFCVEQYFLPNLGEEKPLLAVVAERFANASCLVSYNGKAFDWPLLRARLLLNRVPIESVPPHVDLLHCCRRVFKRRLDSMRLTQIEQNMLGFIREDDIDGAEVPVRYLNYLHSGQSAELEAVFKHNALDLLALYRICGALSHHYHEPLKDTSSRDKLGYAEVAERNARLDKAYAFALSARQSDLDDKRAQSEAKLMSAKIAKRRGIWHEHEGHLLEAVVDAYDELHRAAAHLALAKFYEHKTRDYVRALEHAKHTEPVEGLEACARRCQRLASRLG